MPTFSSIRRFTPLHHLASNAAALLAVAFFCAGVTARAQTNTTAPPPSHVTPAVSPATPTPAGAAPAEEAGVAAKDDIGHVGIKMHGHWTINIKNPDGTLVEHREFENSILLGGQYTLLELLEGYEIPGNWGIQLGTNGGTSPCISAQNTAGSNYCFIVQSLTTNPGTSYCTNAYYCATGLTNTFSSTAPGSITLAGSITANNTGTIGLVTTILGVCYVGSPSSPTVETNAPSTCPVSGTNASSQGTTAVSQTTVSNISVANGQIIQVSVVITFS